jgi:hypothetical protein
MHSTSVNLNYLKKGEYFTLKNIDEPKESQVWIRGEYDRSSNEYSCTKFSDMNSERFFKGDREVFVGFTF